MKNNVLQYKGYHAKVEFDTESCMLRGKIEGINDYVDFESSDVQMIETEFHNAVDDYLEFCKEVGKEPDKEYKGSFNVRIDPSLHQKLAVFAFKNGESLNQTVEKAIRSYLRENAENEVIIKEEVSRMLEAWKNKYTPAFFNGVCLEQGMVTNIVGSKKNINMGYK